jgi:uncharacterized protein (DUF1330 family)
MATYIISDLTIQDAAAMEVYRTRAAESIVKQRGRTLSEVETSKSSKETRDHVHHHRGIS